jgi:hypothetical protein
LNTRTGARARPGQHASLAAAGVAIIVAWSHYRRTRRVWPLIGTITTPAVITLSVWIMYGDPSGNFEGVRSRR